MNKEEEMNIKKAVKRLRSAGLLENIVWSLPLFGMAVALSGLAMIGAVALFC